VSIYFKNPGISLDTWKVHGFVFLLAPWILVSVSATTVTFNDLALGASPDGDYGDFVLDSARTVYDGRQDNLTIWQQDGIVEWYLGDQTVSSLARFSDVDPETLALYPDLLQQTWATITVNFKIRVTDVSVDAMAAVWNGRLGYSGYDSSGALFQQTMTILGTDHVPTDDLLSYDFSAPEGGCITGFYLLQADSIGAGIRMDNLSYIAVPESISTLGGLAFAIFALYGVGFNRKWRPKS
jgi:hypothetical protein